MAFEIRMPQLGLTMEEGTVTSWAVKEGDTVKKDDVLLEVTTDKLSNEIQSEYDGTILKLVAKEGEDYKVKDILAYVGEPGEVIGSGEEAEQDADFLRSVCGELLRFPGIGRYEIRGGDRVESLIYQGEEYPVDAVFIIKDTVSVTQLVPGLRYEKGGIVTGRDMSTDVPGVFAAGDCAGKPYQLAKAAGEGNIAALSACEYLDQAGKA